MLFELRIRIIELLDWLIYYRWGKIKFRVHKYDDEFFVASATTGDAGVFNCYGSTHAAAKEVALFRLKQMLKDDE